MRRVDKEAKLFAIVERMSNYLERRLGSPLVWQDNREKPDVDLQFSRCVSTLIRYWRIYGTGCTDSTDAACAAVYHWLLGGILDVHPRCVFAQAMAELWWEGYTTAKDEDD